jgi:hypothetical protein
MEYIAFIVTCQVTFLLKPHHSMIESHRAPLYSTQPWQVNLKRFLNWGGSEQSRLAMNLLLHRPTSWHHLKPDSPEILDQFF